MAGNHQARLDAFDSAKVETQLDKLTRENDELRHLLKRFESN